MHAYVFPGQGAQFVGMGKDLYDNVPLAKELFDKANEILGFSITDIMFAGTDEQLKQTKVTQPAIFLHSVILAKSLGDEFKPDMTAGHSLGEFSALVAAGALSFEDGLKLVSKRAQAMQKACEQNPSTMAAIIGHPDDGIYPLEYEPIVEAAKETNTLLEVNNNSLNPAGSRKHTRENLIAMLELCKEYKQPVIMNSDSHVFCDVARRDFSEKLIKEIDFPEELIVNRSVDVFKEYIHRKYEEK